MAKLLLEKNSNLVFLGSRQWTNPKNQNILTFAKLGDPQTFENHEFMVDPQKVNLNLPLHANISPDFDLTVYNGRTSLNLVGLQVASAIASKAQ